MIIDSNEKQLNCWCFLGQTSCFSQVGLLSESHLTFQKSHNELNNLKRPENIKINNYTIEKYKVMFYGHGAALTSAVVKSINYTIVKYKVMFYGHYTVLTAAVVKLTNLLFLTLSLLVAAFVICW